MDEKYEEPRSARVKERVLNQRADVLIGMGLRNPAHFWVVGEKDGQPVVSPDDLSRFFDKPFTLNKEIVEFIES